MVSHRSLSDSNSPQVSRTRLSILADLNNAVVWILSTCPLISKSSNPFTNFLWFVPSAPTTIGITITFMCDFFFSSLGRSKYLYLFSLSFISPLWSFGTAKPTIRQVLFFLLLIITRSCRLTETRWLVCISNPREFCASHSSGRTLSCVYTTCLYCQIKIFCTTLSG